MRAIFGSLRTVRFHHAWTAGAADVEGIMVYLASDESTYATGGLFTVDGGLTAL